MTKQIKFVPANDTFAVLKNLDLALNKEQVLFVTTAEINGIPPKVDFDEELFPETAVIIESSGSTGIPKRIQHSAQSLLYSAEQSLHQIGGPGQWLLALPTNFIAGLQVLTRSIVSETQPVLLNTQLPFTAESFFRGASLMDGQRKYTSLVPTQLARLAKAAREDAFGFSMLRQFDAILLGGQQPNWATVTELRAMGINIVISYGMTETAGGCVFDGTALPGVDTTLENDRIRISGPVLAQGLGESFLTQDLGEYREGKLEVLGRADRVIVSGGKKVLLDRVEQVAADVAGVQQVVAISLSDPSWGERVGLVYQGSPEAEIVPALVSEIGPEAKPIKIKQLAQLPLLVSGKPDLLTIKNLLTDSI